MPSIQSQLTVAAFAATLVCGSALWAAPTNLAPLGTASADSAEFGSVAGDANDGNRDGNFGNGSVWHSDNVGVLYWEVDLGANYTLDRVELFSRADGGQFPWWDDFKIEVFDNSNSLVFTHNYLSGGGGTEWPWGASNLRNVVGQRVRITSNNLNKQAAMAEFEVYGKASGTFAPNLALTANVTGQAAAFGSTLDDVHDGDIDGNFGHGSVYHSDHTGSDQFIQFDLGAMTALDYIIVYARTDSYTTGPIKVSVLDESLSEVYSDSYDLGSLFGYDFTSIVGGISGRYVRIAPTAEQNFALAEVEIFGVVPEPATLSLAALGLLMAGRRRRAA